MEAVTAIAFAPCKSPVEQLPRRACAAELTDSRVPRASHSTRGTTHPARHSSPQKYCDMLHDAEDSVEKLAPFANPHASAPDRRADTAHVDAAGGCHRHQALTPQAQHRRRRALAAALHNAPAQEGPLLLAALCSATSGQRCTRRTHGVLSEPRGGGRPSEREPHRRPCPAQRRASGTEECNVAHCVTDAETSRLVIFWSKSSRFHNVRSYVHPRRPARCQRLPYL